MQTIGILVAEKTDLSAKLTQTSKQLERKQGEIDVIQGRLKECRERLDDFERQNQNSTINAQKRDAVRFLFLLDSKLKEEKKLRFSGS